MISSLSSSIQLYALCSIIIFSIAGLSASLQSQQAGFGYSLVSLHEADGGLVAYLQVKQKSSIYGPDIPHLRIFVKHETKDRLRIHITDAEKERWEVPYNLIPREQPPPLNIKKLSIHPFTSTEFSGDELVFSYTPDPFGFAVKRKSDGQILFNSNYGTLVFKDQYLEISTQLPESASLYGFGETTQPTGIRLQPNDVHTLYTTDNGAYNINTNLYGSHPTYMELRNVAGEAFAHGVLLLNSNGMDVFYTGKSLTYKVIGGVLDFYFFAGPSPLAVVDQFTRLVGRPAAMPYWALGFHQCRWGYHNLSVVEGVVEGYKKAKIPLDVMWTDDDHMDSSKDFTLSSVNFPRPQMLAFLEKIHSQGMKYVVIVDPGIAVNSSYGVFLRGMEKDVFIKYNGKPFLAQVWPGAVYFPDFLNPDAVSWWADEIARFHQLVPVDGLWIDMNEVSNFCSGECEIPANRKCPDPTLVKPSVCCLNCKNITSSKWDEPPYKINKFATKAPLGYKTVATSATHYNGILEYNAHSLYGFSEAIATYKALLSPDGKQHRPFVLSRSTFVGTGAYAAHWTGDNKGTWEDLRYSITSILNFGIFGMPMVGADICGFYPQPTEELCNRWIELGAFYPFSRDHSNFRSKRQELYQWNSVAQSARNALGLRYRLLPYLYTLSYQAHKTGAPIARPVFFNFPKFAASYGLSTQFMLGSSVLVSPVLKQGATTVEAIFPPGSWYNLFNMTRAIISKDERYVTLDAPLHEINVHVYQNTILPMQRGGMVSSEARRTPFTLIVVFPFHAIEADAKGEVFVDNDERPEPLLVEGEASYVEFYATVHSGRTVSIWSDVQMGRLCMEKALVIEKVKVLGLQGVAEELSIEVDGQHLTDTSKVYINGSPSWQQGKQENGIEKSNMVTEVGGLAVPLGKKFFITWKMRI